MENNEINCPWGKINILDDEGDIIVKRLEIASGQQFSLHTHRHKDKLWFFHKGVAQVIFNDNEKIFHHMQYITIPRDTAHQIKCVSDEPVVLFEIQTGDYLGDDDIDGPEHDFCG